MILKLINRRTLCKRNVHSLDVPLVHGERPGKKDDHNILTLGFERSNLRKSITAFRIIKVGWTKNPESGIQLTTRFAPSRMKHRIGAGS